ncbi:ABC transporter ATP-binding protein [bacterium]|nr:MAG: ABC transporter ATP-binding protein [bacterium]
MAPVLRACGLTKRYGERVAVDDLSLDIPAGGFYGLLGPNGAGKTTTLSMLVGVLKPDGGTIEFGGAAVNAGSPVYKRRIGYVPQELALYDDLSAADNLRFFGALYGLSGKTLETRVSAALELAGLLDRAKDRVDGFSGGMKRRLNLAAALLHDPEVIVLDEPTVGVDPQSRNALFEALESLRAAGKTLIYTTHYMEEVERLCDRIAIVDAGKVVAEGTLEELRRLVPGERRLVIEVDGAADPRLVADLPGVRSVKAEGSMLTLNVDSLEHVLPLAMARFLERGVRYGSLSSGRISLEEVFLHLTGKTLRD